MKREIQFSILFDMRRDFKPFGIWVTDGKLFDQFYIENSEYRDKARHFHKCFDDFDFSNMDWYGFWEYWTSQGGYHISISNPFSIVTDKQISDLGKEAIHDLDKFLSWMKRKNMKPIYEY